MDAANLFALNDEQQERLLVLRAAWDEGEDEERLERLRLREEDAETVRAFGQVLTDADFAHGASLTWAQMAHLLALARALAPNPNLDARLLRRAGEPEALNHDLRELLFGKGSDANRLRGFLSRRHAGGQTAMQLLCAHQPETWPLVTRLGLRALRLSPVQERGAARAARVRFELPAEIKGVETYSNQPIHVGVGDNDLILRLLADVIVYEAVCETLDAPDYLAVHRLLTRGLMSRAGRGRFASPTLPASSAPSFTADTRRVNDRAANPSEHSAAYDRANTDVRRAADPDVAFVREPSRPDYDAQSFSNMQDITANEAPAPVDTTGYTQSDLLTALEREIAAQGFTYPALIVRDYYLCLQSKPFVLLSGLSGTGKTRLTSLFAQALTGNASGHAPTQPNAQYRLLPVRPDWMDSTPIVGYVNLLAPTQPQSGGPGTFVSTPFLDFLLRAARPDNANRAYFLCLDEMNLARVEHYFAEVLSAMETSGRDMLLPDGRAIRLPANLFLSGTLNLDEATHSLSRKVLDRANTLTFGEVCLREDDHTAQDGSQQAALDTQTASAERMPFAVRQALFLGARAKNVADARIRLQSVSPPGTDYAGYVVNTLADVNALLEPHGLHFAYRIRDETLRYCANSFDTNGLGLLSPDKPNDLNANLRAALDLQLLQKVLPRLTGTQEQLEAPTADLLRYAEKHRFVLTARRLARLQTRLQRDGYAGFDAL